MLLPHFKKDLKKYVVKNNLQSTRGFKVIGKEIEKYDTFGLLNKIKKRKIFSGDSSFVEINLDIENEQQYQYTPLFVENFYKLKWECLRMGICCDTYIWHEKIIFL